jgi:hypothetical protein
MATFVRSMKDIIGHKYIVNYLNNKIAQDKVPDVILFSGISGIGKTSIAKILAIAVNGYKENLFKPIIDDNSSTDCIKLFNMSSIGDETDLVVSELQSTSFSSTGRKVIILDEVHGMTKKAQDAILVTLEYLPENIYVFLCTTEKSLLRESLVSRCKQLDLNNLSYNEIKELINNKIQERGLTFDINKDMVLNLIASWSNNQPRQAINLLEAFEINSRVNKDDLSAFISTNNVPIIISLLGYLYGSLTKGIEFVDTLSITPDLLGTMIEVLKVGLGHTSSLVSREDSMNINRILATADINNYLKFVVKVNSTERISKRVFIAKFIECHSSILNGNISNLNIESNINNSIAADTRTIGDTALDRLRKEAIPETDFDREDNQAVSMDTLFNLGKKVED